MKSSRFIALLGLTASLALTPHVFAQGSGQTTTPTDFGQRLRTIQVRNVPSALLAYQLDPAHNPFPIALGLPPAPHPAAKAGDKEKGAFDLPGDIEQIVSIDPQNVLLVKGGSDQDIRRLQELINILDQPLRRIEIEARYVETTREFAEQLGVSFVQQPTDGAPATPAAQTATRPAVSFVGNNLMARLNALVAGGSAKIIAAPRAQAINNLGATLNFGASRTIKLNSVAGGSPASTPLDEAVELKVVPTINGDDTVTLLMELPPIASESESKASGKAATFIVNLRDGQTVALSGLSLAPRINTAVPILNDIPIIGNLFRAPKADESQESLIFVTARIVRPTEKPTATPTN